MATQINADPYERAFGLLSPASSKKECPTLPPMQMRLEMRTRDGKVPSHASPDVVKSDYLANVMSPIGLQKVVRKTCRIIKKSGVEFDAVAFRGFSGALVGPLIACKLKKGFLAVRKHKKDENCHSSQRVEGAVRTDCRYIIIDDLISTGATIWNIVADLRTYVFEECDPRDYTKTIAHAHVRKCVGVFLYNSWTADDKDYDYDSMREIFPPCDADCENSIYLPVWTFKAPK